MIYLDNAATTQISKEALITYNKYAEEIFYNPSAIYSLGVQTKSNINEARKTIKHALGTNDGNIIFTSSATEANNLAIFGTLRSNFKKAVFSMGDHPSSYNVALELEKRGVKVEFCPLQNNGQIDYEILEQIVDERTDLISIIHVSNETGAINDLKKINEIRQKKCPNAIFHADGVQAFSKIKVNLNYFGVDLYTISSHKIHGPKGIAALFVKNGIIVKPLILGGGQESNLRSGTENVPAIMAFKTAVENTMDIKKNLNYIAELKNAFIKNLSDISCKVNSDNSCSPYILSLSFSGVKGETLVHMMEQNDIYISTGSACSTKKEGNRTLESMKIRNEDILGSVRISFSKHNTLEEINIASNKLKECYKELLQKLR